ncbi:MAG TPA: DUF6683 family protein [Steroidobacteraceae bacterium]|jgi:hypothetical protein
MRTLTRLMYLGVCCSFNTAAIAQWNPQVTADLGRGLGQLALSQSVLSGTRRLGSDAATANNANVPPVSSRNAATLTYVPDPKVSEQTRLAMIEALSKPNPALRPQMESALSGGLVPKVFDRFMAAHGYSSRNVADDMAMELLVSWEIVTGGAASARQIRGADNQLRGIFLSTPQLRAMTNAERQQIAENIAYRVVIESAANRQLQRAGDPAQLAQLRQSAAAILRERGVDVSHVQLTDRGFVKTS